MLENEKELPFYRRFYLYQKERFPFLGHGALIAAFSFSAISYSRICRGIHTFIDWNLFYLCIFNTITLFFLLRVFDEFKDKDDDAKFRTYLPVPRGLISLNELKKVGFVFFTLQILVNTFFVPTLLPLYAMVIGYLLLMGKEFFVVEWLKRHQFWYVVSHMLIIPLVDVFASGFDWKIEKANPSTGLLFFFAVSFMNGIVLEIGRKIKAPEKEEEGVVSYSGLLGANKAAIFWIVLLAVTLVLAFTAASYSGQSYIELSTLIVLFVICSLPAIWFLFTKKQKAGKMIEIASALWTFGMYLMLGGIPMLKEIFGF